MSTNSQLKDLVIMGATQLVASKLSRNKASMFWSIASGALLGFSMIFLSISVFFYFAQMVVLASAGLYTSAMVFVLSAGCYLFMRIRQRQIREVVLREQETIESIAEMAFSTYESEIEEPIKEHPALSLLISGITGFAVAKKYL